MDDIIERLENKWQKIFYVKKILETPQNSKIIKIIKYHQHTFAALKSIQDSVNDPLNYYDVNVLGTISLLNAMRVNGVKIFFSSSATIYGEPEYLPIDENHSNKAINPYGKVN